MARLRPSIETCLRNKRMVGECVEIRRITRRCKFDIRRARCVTGTTDSLCGLAHVRLMGGREFSRFVGRVCGIPKAGGRVVGGFTEVKRTSVVCDVKEREFVRLTETTNTACGVGRKAKKAMLIGLRVFSGCVRRFERRMEPLGRPLCKRRRNRLGRWLVWILFECGERCRGVYGYC